MTTPSQPYPAPETMTCVELVELVTEYLDGALDDAERLRLERHLAGCGGCRAYVEQFKATIAAVGRPEPGSVPKDVLARIVAAYREFRKG